MSDDNNKSLADRLKNMGVSGAAAALFAATPASAQQAPQAPKAAQPAASAASDAVASVKTGTLTDRLKAFGQFARSGGRSAAPPAASAASAPSAAEQLMSAATAASASPAGKAAAAKVDAAARSQTSSDIAVISLIDSFQNVRPGNAEDCTAAGNAIRSMEGFFKDKEGGNKARAALAQKCPTTPKP